MTKKDILKQKKAENYDGSAIDRPAGDNWVTMSNTLTRAGHGLNLSEKRLIMMGVSKLDSLKFKKNEEMKGVHRTKITAKEYAECFDVDINTAYDQLKSGADKLYERSICFYVEAFNRKGDAISPTVKKRRWIGGADYQKDEGWIELSWNPDISPHLFNIRKNFTSYQLKQASALRCQHSWKLLELLMRFQSTGVAKYTIEDFCVSMDATEKQRANFAFVRRRIIEPAVKELTEKDNWEIHWEAIKAGRKVKEIKFIFGKNPQADMFSGY